MMTIIPTNGVKIKEITKNHQNPPLLFLVLPRLATSAAAIMYVGRMNIIAPYCDRDKNARHRIFSTEIPGLLSRRYY